MVQEVTPGPTEQPTEPGMSDQAAHDLYAAKGFGQKFEYGTNPAVVVIDFSCGFTDPACALGADLTKLTPEQAAAFVRNDIRRWREIGEKAQITLQQ